MFTGIVEAVGLVHALHGGAGGGRVEILVDFAGELEEGESVAVDGCCLTAVRPRRGWLHADLSPETLARTTLALKGPGSRANLERALAAGSRLGGHFVAGHVDGTTRVLEVAAEGDGLRQRYALADEDAPLVVPKGSVAVDGVSLTVADLGPGWFEVALVPHTLASTTLGERRAGDAVNLELDVVGKYLLRAAALSGRVALPPGTRRRLGLSP